MTNLKTTNSTTPKVYKGLIKLKDEFQLEIEENVLNQIKSYHNLYPNLEWSGIIFYDLIGDIDDIPNMKCVIKDFCLMDLGTAGATKIDMTEGFIEYINKYPDRVMKSEYQMYEQGLLHSHHGMATYFSNEDKEELEDNAPNHRIYLSVVVNNKNEVTSGIVFETETKIDIKLRDNSSKEFISSTQIYLIHGKWINDNKVVILDECKERYEFIKQLKESKAVIENKYNPRTYINGQSINSHLPSNHWLNQQSEADWGVEVEEDNYPFGYYNLVKKDIEFFKFLCLSFFPNSLNPNYGNLMMHLKSLEIKINKDIDEISKIVATAYSNMENAFNKTFINFSSYTEYEDALVHKFVNLYEDKESYKDMNSSDILLVFYKFLLMASTETKVTSSNIIKTLLK